MLTPAPLRHGDTIAIISPATIVNPDYIDGAARLISDMGYVPLVMPHAKGPACGSYAAPAEDRVSDLLAALRDPHVKAILCARGGYGCAQLLPHIPRQVVTTDPKWIIGFSDVSALLALYATSGVLSIHGPMAKHLTEEGADDVAVRMLFDIMEGKRELTYPLTEHRYNVIGETEGILVGGNLAVLNDLVDTPYDMYGLGDEDQIVFIEDIAEQIYAVERTLRRLFMSPMRRKIRALIVGSFTDYRYPDRNFSDMYEMIHALLREYGMETLPVVYGFPTGHTRDNMPLVVGSHVRLTSASLISDI